MSLKPFSPSRDEFVEILWDNIIPDQFNQFRQNNPEEVLEYGLYDYGSVMHYEVSAFQKSAGLNTIRGKVRETQEPCALLLILVICARASYCYVDKKIKFAFFSSEMRLLWPERRNECDRFGQAQEHVQLPVTAAFANIIS